MTLLSAGCAQPQLAGFSLDGTNAVAIRTDWLRARDLFVIAQQFNRDGSVDVKVIVNPLVDMIWLAGAVFLLDSVVAVWPDARERCRHARRALEVGMAGA
jgi:cytochrome c biogenesis factor